MLTPGTTGVGSVDRIDEALDLRERYGVRLHADAAYGGFFALLGRAEDPLVAPGPFEALAACDSIVVDPHKHGLQPYGCGAVLFADPSVGRLYKHDSPYTYFTRASSTSARSAWSARARALPPRRSGSPCVPCRWSRTTAWAGCWPRGAERRWTGPRDWRARTC